MKNVVAGTLFVAAIGAEIYAGWLFHAHVAADLAKLILHALGIMH